MRGVFTKHYGDLLLFEDLEVEVLDGAVNRITGPSGRGKTTLMRLMSGLEENEAGAIGDFAGHSSAWVFQEDRLVDFMSALTNITIGDFAGHSSAWVFQEDRLVDFMSALTNITLAVGRTVEKAVVVKALKELGLDDPAKAVGDYSGGMRRRVALCRALLSDGEVLYLDEPFTGLDSATRAQAASFIERYRRGRTLILVDHEDEAEPFLPVENAIAL